MRKFMRDHCARKLTNEEWFSVFNPVWETNMTAHIVQAGFRRTGIWPVDREKITDEKLTMFAPQDSEGCEFHPCMYIHVQVWWWFKLLVGDDCMLACW